MYNPPPVLGFADDIALSAYDVNVLKAMIDVSEPAMLESGLDVKPSKSALFYGRRSGNNWYKGKNDTVPEIFVQQKLISVYSRTTS